MKKSSTAYLFKCYIWLINTIARGPISREMINEKWAHSSVNDYKQDYIPESNFHRWKNTIELLFDIRIKCNSNNEYYIEEAADLRGADLRGAYLGGAYLGSAYLRGAYLRGADLDDWGKLQSYSDILIAGVIGSRNDYTTIFHTDKGIFVQCGCFIGTLEEFEAKVKETHQGNNHEKDYLALIQFAKIKFGV